MPFDCPPLSSEHASSPAAAAAAAAAIAAAASPAPAPAPAPIAPRWPLSALRGFVGVSGVYTPDDPATLAHFESRGLSRRVVWAIMEAGISGERAEAALRRASPVALLRAAAAELEFDHSVESPVESVDEGGSPGETQWHTAQQVSPAKRTFATLLPRVTLCHGTGDASSPFGQSVSFAAALRDAGLSGVDERYYEGKSHTDPFLEDPILGGKDALLEDVLGLVHAGEGGEEGGGKEWPTYQRMLPLAVVQLARRCTPF
jgi:prenylcysteine alpha-carboxyl methylesterase